jgi:hypothetical protein
LLLRPVVSRWCLVYLRGVGFPSVTAMNAVGGSWLDFAYSYLLSSPSKNMVCICAASAHFPDCFCIQLCGLHSSDKVYCQGTQMCKCFSLLWQTEIFLPADVGTLFKQITSNCGLTVANNVLCWPNIADPRSGCADLVSVF